MLGAHSRSGAQRGTGGELRDSLAQPGSNPGDFIHAGTGHLVFSMPGWWGTGHPETAGNLLCLWLLSPVFISQDSVAEKDGNLLSLSWLRHSKKAKINAIETEAIGT